MTSSFYQIIKAPIVYWSQKWIHFQKKEQLRSYRLRAQRQYHKIKKMINRQQSYKALETLQQTKYLHPFYPALQTLHIECLIDHKQYMHAEQLCCNAIKKDPCNLKLQSLLFYILEKTKRYEQLTRECQKALKLEPKNKEAKDLLQKYMHHSEIEMAPAQGQLSELLESQQSKARSHKQIQILKKILDNQHTRYF